MGSTNTKEYTILTHELVIYNVKNIYATILNIIIFFFFFFSEACKSSLTFAPRMYAINTWKYFQSACTICDWINSQSYGMWFEVRHKNYFTTEDVQVHAVVGRYVYMS